MKATYTYILIGLLSAHSIVSNGQSQWKLAKETNSTRVYTKDHSEGQVKEFKATTVFEDVSVNELYTLFKNVNEASKWSYAVEKSVKLATTNTDEDIVYYRLDFPWPLKSRDVIQKQTLRWKEVNKEFTISSYSVPNYLPIEKGYVRVVESSVKWTVKQINKDDVAITYEFYTDPKVAVPDNITQYFSVNGPILVFEKLNHYLKGPTPTTASNSVGQ